MERYRAEAKTHGTAGEVWTEASGKVRTIATTYTVSDAEMIARALNNSEGAVVVDDAAVERVAKALMGTPPDMLTAEPYTVARALLTAAKRGR